MANRVFESVYKNIGQGGSFKVSKVHCKELRKNLVVRMAFAASLGSVLIEPLNILPFVFHIWSGESGTCRLLQSWQPCPSGGILKWVDWSRP